MNFTISTLARSLADYLADFLPGVTMYEDPNQQGIRKSSSCAKRESVKRLWACFLALLLILRPRNNQIAGTRQDICRVPLL